MMKPLPMNGFRSVRELSLYTYRILYEVNGQDIYIWPWCINGGS